MLEPFVSSRIRRTLLEHLLKHPQERFYLRGLAKELTLTVSPLRRELKRLEHLGVLKTTQEGNLLFYVVDQTSPLFGQLQQAVQHPGTLVASTVVSDESLKAINPRPQPVMSWPVLIGSVSLVLFVALALGITGYLAGANKRLLALTKTAVSTPASQITVVEVPPHATTQAAQTREMRGSRWRLVPGSIGGFSAGVTQESY